VRLPPGSIVLGRSGDKCSDANVGLFIRKDEEWEWLRSLLIVEKIKELLVLEEYKGKPVDRFETSNIRAVHFLLYDHLYEIMMLTLRLIRWGRTYANIQGQILSISTSDS
jgi:hypothetical protein